MELFKDIATELTVNLLRYLTAIAVIVSILGFVFFIVLAVVVTS